MKKWDFLEWEVYTDGSCKKNFDLSFGGWAYIVRRGGNTIQKSCGAVPNTTNQRMELLSVINALNYIAEVRSPKEKVIIYSDSAYLINCYMQEWWKTWTKNGWKNAKREEVANRDLWWELIPFFQNTAYEFRKVKGHADNVWNNECDKLAQAESENLKLRWKGIDDYEQRAFFGF